MTKVQWIGEAKNQVNILGKDGYPVPRKDLPKGIVPRKRSLLFRKKFVIDKEIASARGSVCGLGFYYLYLNEKKPDENAVLMPVYSAYSKKVSFDTYDVTDILNYGENIIGVEVGTGWYAPANEKWDGWRMRWYASPRLALELEIAFTDQTHVVIETDESWKISDGGVMHSCIYDGETFDANAEEIAWKKVDFNDENWKNAVVVEKSTENIVESRAPRIRIQGSLKPVRTWQADEKTYLYDFGENRTALPFVEAMGPKGESLMIECAEFLDGNQDLDKTSNNNALNTDRYIFYGQGVESYRPKFTFHCYRFLKISLSHSKIKLVNVESHYLHSDVERIGSFDCSNEKLNYLHDCFVRTQLNCLVGVPIDCPQRDERLPWLGDGHATSEMCVYNFDMEDLYANWLDDMAVGKTTFGTIQFIAPSVLDATTIDWNMAYPIILKEVYNRYGNQEILHKHYPVLKEHTEYYIRISRNGFGSNGDYGDWMSIDKVPGCKNIVVGTTEFGDNRNPEYCGTLFYYHTLRLTSEIASIIDQEEDARYFRAKAEATQKALLDKYFDADAYVFGNGGMFVHAFALYCGLIPAEKEKGVLNTLISEIKHRDYRIEVGVIGTKVLFAVLLKYQEYDLAYKLLVKEGNPGLLNMVAEGRTTLPERWDTDFIADKDNLNSGCHSMFASPDAVLYKMLGGIVIDRSAEYPVVISPYIPQEIKYTHCRQKIKEGNVISNWEKTECGIYYHIEIPEGITAKIKINGGERIVTGGKYLYQDGRWLDAKF